VRALAVALLALGCASEDFDSAPRYPGAGGSDGAGSGGTTAQAGSDDPGGAGGDSGFVKPPPYDGPPIIVPAEAPGHWLVRGLDGDIGEFTWHFRAPRWPDDPQVRILTLSVADVVCGFPAGDVAVEPMELDVLWAGTNANCGGPGLGLSLEPGHEVDVNIVRQLEVFEPVSDAEDVWVELDGEVVAAWAR
jgi:hypothetical protein